MPNNIASAAVLTEAKARSLIASTGFIPINNLAQHPFTVAGARVLLNNIRQVAIRKNLDVCTRDLLREAEIGEREIQFLTKLHNLRIGTTQEGEHGLNARIACATHIFTAADQSSCVTIRDIKSWNAYTVFDFGEREFDALFEMGDGAQVKDALVELAQSNARVAATCREFGWMDASDLQRSHRWMADR